MSAERQTSRFQATALRPKDVHKLREQFRCSALNSNALLSRLVKVRDDLLVVLPANAVALDDLIKSYADEKGCCALCQLPMTLDVLTLQDGSPCSEWQLSATFHRPHRVAHLMCANKNLETDPAEQLDDLPQEIAWLTDLLSQLNVPSQRADHGDLRNEDDDLVGWLAGFYGVFKRMVQQANEPPCSDGSQWSDTHKTKLLKRCNKRYCCGQLNPIEIMQPRRAFKLGQLDSRDYVGSHCPHRGHKKATPPSTLPSALPSSLPCTSVPSVALGTVPATKPCQHQYADEKGQQLAAGVTIVSHLWKLSSDSDAVAQARLAFARRTYTQHEKAMMLHVAGTGASAPVFPMPPSDPIAPEEQWAAQKQICPVCDQEMYRDDAIQWDVCGGAWHWLHARCNGNKWACMCQINRHVPDPDAMWRRLYELRRHANAVFDMVLQCISADSRLIDCLDQDTREQFVDGLRVRVCNLAEQALIQTRFCTCVEMQKELSDAWQQFQAFDPDGAVAVQESFLIDPQITPEPTPGKSDKSAKSRKRKGGAGTARTAGPKRMGPRFEKPSAAKAAEPADDSDREKPGPQPLIPLPIVCISFRKKHAPTHPALTAMSAPAAVSDSSARSG